MYIRAETPEWANGCEKCACGVISAPQTNKLPMYLERAILAEHGFVVFCDCRAGNMARQYARRVWRNIAEKREFVHPDVVAAILVAADTEPTVHADVSS